MTVTVGDILKVVAVMQWLDGNIAQNVYAVKIGTGGGPFDVLDVVDDMEDWLDDMYANLTVNVSNALDGSELRVYVYDAVDDDYDEIGSGVWGWNPSNAGEWLPLGVAALVNAKTTDADVSGKKYIAGMGVSEILQSKWDAAALAALVLYGVDWTTDFVGATSGANFEPGIWSPTRTAFIPFSGTEVIPTFPAYQRRRKQGVGI